MSRAAEILNANSRIRELQQIKAACIQRKADEAAQKKLRDQEEAATLRALKSTQDSLTRDIEQCGGPNFKIKPNPMDLSSKDLRAKREINKIPSPSRTLSGLNVNLR